MADYKITMTDRLLWNQTARLCAAIANQWVDGKKQKPYSSGFFNPYVDDKRTPEDEGWSVSDEEMADRQQGEQNERNERGPKLNAKSGKGYANDDD